MSRHTPGPWSLETVSTSAGSCHKIGPFPSMGVRPHVHACVYADGIRIGLDEKSPVAVELLANARLIAAAPELLEFAEHVRALAFDFLNEGTRPNHHHMRDLAWEAEKIVSKATRATQPLPTMSEVEK